MVYAMMYTGYMVCYEMDSNGNMNKVWESIFSQRFGKKGSGGKDGFRQ